MFQKWKQHVWKRDWIASGQKLCRSLEKNSNFRFGNTAWQILDKKQVVSGPLNASLWSGAERVRKIEKDWLWSPCEPTLVSFPWQFHQIVQRVQATGNTNAVHWVLKAGCHSSVWLRTKLRPSNTTCLGHSDIHFHEFPHGPRSRFSALQWPQQINAWGLSVSAH